MFVYCIESDPVDSGKSDCIETKGNRSQRDVSGMDFLFHLRIGTILDGSQLCEGNVGGWVDR